jgi:hypothetical protein
MCTVTVIISVTVHLIQSKMASPADTGRSEVALCALSPKLRTVTEITAEAVGGGKVAAHDRHFGDSALNPIEIATPANAEKKRSELRPPFR